MEQNTGNRPVLKEVARHLDHGDSFYSFVNARDFDCSVTMYKMEGQPTTGRWDRPHLYMIYVDGEEWPFMYAKDAARTYIKLVGRNRAWEEVQWLEATEHECS